MSLRAETLLKGGEYRIERVLGQGGFGITYLGIQVALNRKVAIKEFFMKEHCNRDSETSHVSVPSEGSKELVGKFRAKFIKEAQTIACLNHPHIIRIYDVFEENGTAYYVMEYWDNGSLADLVKKQGKLSEAEALKYIRQVADALRYIHERKMNHLDVKPGNILLDENRNAVLIDFGLSKRYDEEGNQTSTTPVGISHGYAPLEQYKKGGVGTFSPATDIYSLGATLYKLLTGETPPDADVISDDGLPALPHDVSAFTSEAIGQAMQPGRKKRPQSVEEFMALLSGEEDVTIVNVGPKPTSKPQSGPKPKPKAQPSPKPKPKAQPRPKPKAQLDPKPQPHPQPVPAPSPSSWKKWAVSLAMCVIAALAVLFWPNVGDDKPEDTIKEVSPSQYTGIINGHKYVDLGLSVKWADRNVGASSPSDYGDYFAWGETSTKSDYSRSTSVTYEKDFSDIVGKSQYDAARANWGGTWRLPTKAECVELHKKCTWTWTTQGGHNGYKVTDPNGNSIFLPAAGVRDGTSLNYAGEYGYYWSSTPGEGDSPNAYSLFFGSGDHSVGWGFRSNGHAVRPVSD